jgi:hypothetical protein
MAEWKTLLKKNDLFCIFRAIEMKSFANDLRSMVTLVNHGNFTKVVLLLHWVEFTIKCSNNAC